MKEVKHLRCIIRSITLGPIKLSASNDVTNTRNTRNPKPKTDSSNQFLSFVIVSTSMLLKSLYGGLAENLNKSETTESSSICNRSTDIAGLESKRADQKKT